jgi:cardiolipin synthase
MSSPQEGSESVRLMYLLSIACARQSIRLESAYFVPDSLSVQALADACRRGVKVQIIVPGPLIDAHVARRAGRSRWGGLLEAGVEIYEYQPCMFHCKVLIVDDRWVSVGSTNFDNRSFRLNDEANLNILDVDFAQAQSEVFHQDLARSRRITLDEWQNRPWTEKAKEHVAGLFRSQL